MYRKVKISEKLKINVIKLGAHLIVNNSEESIDRSKKWGGFFLLFIFYERRTMPKGFFNLELIPMEFLAVILTSLFFYGLSTEI